MILTDVLQSFFFVFDKRDPAAFKNWKALDIFNELVRARREGTMLLSRKKNGAITGLVIGNLKEDNMHVTCILAKRGVMTKFYKIMRAKWPGVKTLTAERKTKPTTYTVEQLDRRLN